MTSPAIARQIPVDDRAPSGVKEYLGVVVHPAFRLGFLDAQRNDPFDHDDILRRIETETPRSALNRIGWRSVGGWRKAEIAQYRYEEGRLLQRIYGLRCRGWSKPDCPPKAVVKTILMMLAEGAAR